MKVKVQTVDKLSNKAYHAASKARWRLIYRGFNGEEEEINIPESRGDQPFDAHLNLNPGYYRLETGRREKIIRNFLVTSDGRVFFFEAGGSQAA